MSTLIEQKAIKFLTDEFKSENFIFEKSEKNSGYDLIMKNKLTGEITSIELKATNKCYSQNMHMGNVVFSTLKEAELFEQGLTKILRVFLGDEPPKIFLFDNRILANGAKLEQEYRSTIKGKKNYTSVSQIN